MFRYATRAWNRDRQDGNGFAILLVLSILVGCGRDETTLDVEPGLARPGRSGRSGILTTRPVERWPEAAALDVKSISISGGIHGLIGLEYGAYYIRPEKFSDYYGRGDYVGLRYVNEMGLNATLCVTAGYYEPEAKEPGLAELEYYAARATLELGGSLWGTLSRWFLGVGGGYVYLQENAPAVPALGLPELDNELTVHSVLGFSFRNESIMSLRVEGGHTWLLESGADTWTATGALSLQF